MIDGEPLPAAQAPRQSPDMFSHIDPTNPFVIFALIVIGAILRSVLGRLIGSVATGGVVATLAWFVAGSLAASVILGAVAFLLTMFGETIMSSGGRGGWVGGGGSFSGGSSSDSGGFSGGGGSFGGGGASGSW